MQRRVVPVSSEGVVTIPEEFRERLGGEFVEFVVRDDRTIEIRPAQVSLEGVFGPMPSIDREEGPDREVAIGYIMRLNNAEGFKKLLGR